MRTKHPARLYFVLSLTLLLVPSLIIAAESESDQARESGDVIPDTPLDPAVVDVCTPLIEARMILNQLKPPVNAHLERKIGGSAGPFGNRGWGDGLGWGNEGPVSTTLRLLPRLLNHLLSPTRLLSHLPFDIPLISSATSGSAESNTRRRNKNKPVKISKARRERVERVMALMDKAEEDGCNDVWRERGKLRMFPPKGIKQDLPAAYAAYSKYLEKSSDPEAQFMMGFFHATGLGGAVQDQGKALLYYTFSALGGYRPAEMVLGYRYWAGIGVKEDCMTALDYYESSAEKAYAYFLTGPPGGHTLPLTPTRLSDRSGGIYGPHASWASTGANAIRASVKASSAIARGETEKEVLEYYQYHSDRDSHIYTARLGRLYYLGSVYFLPGGTASGAEGVGEIPQSFDKARQYFMKVARVFWPVDLDGNGAVAPKRKMGKDAEDALREPAMVAAGFLGRMAMRGEGMKRDYKRAKMWYERSAELGDREAHNGLGIIYRDGLGVPVDRQKAFHYFQAAAGQDLAEAQVNLGKMHMERGELALAMQMYEVALRHGSPFEAFHLLASIHAVSARRPASQAGRPGMCGVSVAWFKLVSEKGNWKDDFIGEADRAWARGEENKAMLGWWIAAEMGYEAGQNNVAFLLDRGLIPFLDEVDGDELVEREMEMEGKALVQWIRSAAQDNVDAMVKVGDYYYRSESLPPAQRYERAASYYQTAADTQSSSLAYWNLGWMYELGQGVPRDWHLAKRFYDLSLETSQDAYLPVTLSLLGLYLRSWYVEITTRGEVKGLSVFGDELNEDEMESEGKGLWDRIKNLFTADYSAVGYDGFNDAGEEGMNGVEGEGNGYEDYSGAGSGWTGGRRVGEEGDADDFEARARARAELLEDEEDLFETLLIVAVGLGVMGLVYLRGRWGLQEQQRERERENPHGGGGGDGERPLDPPFPL